MTLMDVQEVAWDLDPLVDGEGAEGADRLLAEADERAARFAETYAGQRRRARRRPGSPPRWPSSRRSSTASGRAGNYAMLRFAVDTADPANGALLARVQEQGTAVETKLLFFELEWAARRRRARRRAADRRRPGDHAPPPAHAAPLPPASPLRARGEAHDREGA